MSAIDELRDASQLRKPGVIACSILELASRLDGLENRMKQEMPNLTKTMLGLAALEVRCTDLIEKVACMHITVQELDDLHIDENTHHCTCGGEPRYSREVDEDGEQVVYCDECGQELSQSLLTGHGISQMGECSTCKHSQRVYECTLPSLIPCKWEPKEQKESVSDCNRLIPRPSEEEAKAAVARYGGAARLNYDLKTMESFYAMIKAEAALLRMLGWL